MYCPDSAQKAAGVMSFLPTRSAHSRRNRIGCVRCGLRITLSDQIRKDGDGFVHETCPDGPAQDESRILPAQRQR